MLPEPIGTTLPACPQLLGGCHFEIHMPASAAEPQVGFVVYEVPSRIGMG